MLLDENKKLTKTSQKYLKHLISLKYITNVEIYFRLRFFCYASPVHTYKCKQTHVYEPKYTLH